MLVAEFADVATREIALRVLIRQPNVFGVKRQKDMYEPESTLWTDAETDRLINTTEQRENEPEEETESSSNQ